MRYTLKSSVFICIWVALTVFCGCGGTDNSFTDLSRGWQYAVGNVHDTVSDAQKHHFSPLDSLSNLDKLIASGEGVIWLRKEFSVPDTLRGKELSLLLGTINPVDETYLNGRLIGKGGRFPYEGQHFFSEWNKYRKYDIPFELRITHVNVLLIKIYVFQEGLIEGPIRLGERSAIAREYSLQSFMREGVNALIAFVMFIIGLYHLLIYVKRPKDRENLYYAIVSIFFSFYQTNFYATTTPFNIQYHLSYLTFQKFIFICLYITSYFFVLFTNAFLEISIPRKVQYGIGFFFLLVVGIVFSIRDYGFFVGFARRLNAVVILPTLGYCFVIIAIKAIQKNRLARITLYGLIPFAIGVLFDIIIHNIMQEIGYIYLAGLGFPSFLISIMFILANRFVEYHNEVEELNITLDKKVVERTRELQEANEKLAEAYNAMSRDMKMAISVQENFLPLKPVTFAEWDIAFHFKPMSGVSGDFFDFYECDGNLLGVALFDVSGHGVASGLLTMVAKSILNKNFHENKSLRLAATLQKANEDLINEIGDLGYYMSGIVLRFQGNVVEYVNAAHVDLLLKRYSSDVRVVKSEKKEFKGNFLGLEAMRDRFSTVQFIIESGDVLLLCTDGLVECCNPEGVQYDIERLQKSFAEAPVDKSARAILDFIIVDFHAFACKSDNFRDDITLLIIKKQ